MKVGKYFLSRVNYMADNWFIQIVRCTRYETSFATWDTSPNPINWIFNFLNLVQWTNSSITPSSQFSSTEWTNDSITINKLFFQINRFGSNIYIGIRYESCSTLFFSHKFQVLMSNFVTLLSSTGVARLQIHRKSG